MAMKNVTTLLGLDKDHSVSYVVFKSRDNELQQKNWEILQW